MRILVGTLYCGESDFDDSVASVRSQTHPPVEHLIFKHLPDRVAHEQLFGTFMRRRGDFDLLVKVDADMVLRSSELFAGIVKRFRIDDAMQVLGIKVQDFFTDCLTSGLNSYRNTIEWSPTGDGVFTDQFAYDRRAYRRDDSELAPAATHCPNPSPYQAFHFGVHRGVKARVSRDRRMFESMYMRYRDVELTWRHFLQRHDIRLGLAALGGEMGIGGRFNESHLDYDSAEVRAAFERYSEQQPHPLEAEVRQLRRANFSTVRWLMHRVLAFRQPVATAADGNDRI